MKFEIEGFRERKRGGSSLQKGHKAEDFYRVNRTTILTPVNDRFPAQDFDLVVSKIKGITRPKKLALGGFLEGSLL